MIDPEFDEKFEKHRDIHDNRPTLRDQFAMAALSPIMTDRDFPGEYGAEMISRYAYEIADAMLAERSRKP